MTSEINTTPRPKLSADRVYFEMTSRLPITPPMTLCEEIAERANRYSTNEIWITSQGILMTLGVGDDALRYMELSKVTVSKVVDMQGLLEGEWPEELIKACTAACSVYGILGLT